jgi:ABC-type polysaccharide/polyol phosphate transport system ATPase subunit
MKEIVIRLENISVTYRVPIERYYSFKEYAIRRMQGRTQYQSFFALQDINLEINKGEVIGIIGSNGAGKSTLLKLIARVMKPGSGRVWVKGQVAPLLGVGAGFHPELTGRENVFVNGTLLGFSRKNIQKKLDQIIEFAGLEEWIDAPFRTYSSGMQARLGFAVAMEVEPDILIIDEVLAVGDENFQRKCTARIQTFRAQGVTILLVSHSMGTIRQMCQRAAWLEHGTLKQVGRADEVSRFYEESVQ